VQASLADTRSKFLWTNDYFRFVPAVARPASMKAFMFWIAACSTTCSGEQSAAELFGYV
jgi:chemotaxis methyl-accepting protein methylase